MTTTVGVHGNILRSTSEVVFAQLPRALQNILAVHVEADAFQLVAKAVFIDKRPDRGQRKWEARLVPGEVYGVTANCLISDVDLARLCVEVV